MPTNRDRKIGTKKERKNLRCEREGYDGDGWLLRLGKSKVARQGMRGERLQVWIAYPIHIISILGHRVVGLLPPFGYTQGSGLRERYTEGPKGDTKDEDQQTGLAWLVRLGKGAGRGTDRVLQVYTTGRKYRSF